LHLELFGFFRKIICGLERDGKTVTDIITDTLLDTVKLIPFLFLTYLAMECLEHSTGKKAQAMVKRAGKLGPVIGGILGIVPQCGFSAAASGLYAGRVITLGTLMAIYLSTSDEMLPVLISEQAPIKMILSILLAKAVMGVVTGFVIDFIFPSHKENHGYIHEICENGHCHCEEGGVFRSALVHTLQIALFILGITFVMNLILFFMGEDALRNLLLDRRLLGPALAGLVGMIPNCAGSVAITQLFLEGVISRGAMLSGLLTGTGVGLLVLFRVNHDKKENLKILGLLYFIGVFTGIVVG